VFRRKSGGHAVMESRQPFRRNDLANEWGSGFTVEQYHSLGGPFANIKNGYSSHSPLEISHQVLTMVPNVASDLTIVIV
jgi:hypothetical protein